ncbi:hypothetical protein [Thiomicrorhabdus indica]|uniref:hypothetical protein n=1 Tax=Thiomicrorhabdus indica TaxID=2267253 RepID=UPI002AA75026|nr:hypothetical protein [Thiomicrorhabdus indica]
MLNESKVMQIVKKKQMKKQKGASMIEYALVVAVVVAVGAIFFTGTDAGVGGFISDKLTEAGVTAGTP